MAKGEEAGTGSPGWLGETMGWGPRKFQEGKVFLAEVRSELKKVTWPGRDEVQSTTVVVVVTTIFFGFYLYLLDLAFTQAFALVLR